MDSEGLHHLLLKQDQGLSNSSLTVDPSSKHLNRLDFWEQGCQIVLGTYRLAH